MCIALLSTAHPKYALIVINNRDEFILRPTSPPHWWTIQADATPSSSSSKDPNETTTTQHVLSSRDLLRPEQGTWLGLTRAGHLAVLTNYREIDPATGAPSVTGTKSRGAVATAWLGSAPRRPVADFVAGMIADGATTGVGGFTLICGKLRRRQRTRQQRTTTTTTTTAQDDDDNNLEPLAVLSNKALHSAHIPWVAGRRGETIGLSNAAFALDPNPAEWPKVKKGKALLESLLAEEGLTDEDELRERLFALLSRDDLPSAPGMSLEDHFQLLQESIFIPPLGNQSHRDEMARARAGAGSAEKPEPGAAAAAGTTAQQPAWFSTGLYGTQRQTVILVDWDGNVTYTERSMFDANGVPLEKGKGDETFRFSIEGWDESG